MRTINKIVIHHTASRDTGKLDASDIRRLHKNENGWRDVGYHFIVEQVDDTFEAVVGRPLHEKGAHVRGHNSDSVGVALVGNFEERTPDDRALSVLVSRVLRPLTRLFPDAEIVGHRDLGATLCPGKNIDLQQIRDMI